MAKSFRVIIEYGWTVPSGLEGKNTRLYTEYYTVGYLEGKRISGKLTESGNEWVDFITIEDNHVMIRKESIQTIELRPIVTEPEETIEGAAG